MKKELPIIMNTQAKTWGDVNDYHMILDHLRAWAWKTARIS